MARVLIVDDEPDILGALKDGLESVGHQVMTVGLAEEGVRVIPQNRPDVIILDVLLPDGSGLDVLKKIRDVDDQIPVIFITGSDDSGTAIEAMKRGALDYLVKPLGLTDIREAVQRASEIRALTATHAKVNSRNGRYDRQAIIGKCSAMQDVYKAIGIVATQNVTVLIRGESGTGKELVARALYQHGKRVSGPFLAVNCAAIPETLLESELFGHERGAFTGADRKRIGKFEQCSGGTLFLDEIGDMSPVLQSKLLRVLQDQQFERLGGNETICTDARVIAATNRNLEQMVANNEFRSDLYFRLNGFSIHLPPLKDRGNDLELLIQHFREVISDELGKDVATISAEAMELLKSYPWPGNIRELQNALRQGILKTTGRVLLADFLPDFICNAPSSQRDEPPDTFIDLKSLIEQKIGAGTEKLYDEIIGCVENQLVRRVLFHTQGDKHRAIEKLGVNPTVLRSSAAWELLELNGLDTAQRRRTFEPGMTMAQIEREAIRQALNESKGCRKVAAEMLGISVRTMQRKIKAHQLTF